MSMDYYNTTAIRYVAMAAWKKEVLHTVKLSWFVLTPTAAFAYFFVSNCINRYGKLDDSTFLKAREFDQQSVLNDVKELFPDKTVLHNAAYEELERALNTVLTDVLRDKTETYSERANGLRDILYSVYNQHRYEVSLDKAKSVIKNGGSIEQSYLAIQLPDPISDEHVSFGEQAERILANGISEPVYFGIRTIDEQGGIERGSILTIGGDTGGQKTRFSMWLIIMALIKNPTYKAIIFEREMTKRDILYLICQWLFEKSHYEITLIPPDTLLEFVKELPEHLKSIVDRIIIMDSSDFLTVEDMLHEINKHKPDLWLLDFVTMMVSGSDDTNREVYRISDALKDIAKRSNTAGILISQVKKGTVESRRNKIPYLDDLEWSGRLKHISSQVWMVFHPHNYDVNVPQEYFIVKPVKIRNSGKYMMFFQTYPQIGTYSQADERAYIQISGWYGGYINEGVRK